MQDISVIVPVYKVEPFLHRCVDSILAQTFTDFELILVDDGSPDNCGAICDEYAAKDARIHVIHQQNGGLSAARNAGIDWAFANSDSQWLSFIDSDDWVHPCFLEYLYRAAKESGTDVSACGFIRTEEQGADNPLQAFAFSTEQWDRFYVNNWGVGVVAWNKLYAKELFEGLCYPVGRINEDEFLTYKILARAKTVAVVNAVLYYYFQNPSGIMKSGFSPKKLDGLAALNEQCRFAKKEGLNDLFLECSRRVLIRCADYLCDCKKNNYPGMEIKRAVNTLRRKMRCILLSYGKIPPPSPSLRPCCPTEPRPSSVRNQDPWVVL